MNFNTDTFPQLFYDVIARIIPGFFFLFTLSFGLVDVLPMEKSHLAAAFNSADWMSSLFIGLIYLILCYLTGWVLSSFEFLSLEKKTKNEVSAKYFPQPADMKPFTDSIRAKFPDIGFRLVKLRAEAKMMEKLLWGMAIALLVYAVVGLTKHTNNTNDGLLVALSALLCLAFWVNQKKAWRKYWSSVATHYKILFPDDPAVNPAPENTA